jgi:hypothetical protein
MIEARIRASIDSFVAAWNERDAAQRMRLLERACTEDVLMRTSGRRVIGRDELGAFIADFQRRRPGARAAFSSAVDVQGNLFRYSGVVEGPAGDPGGEALDAGECDEDGRIRLVLSFVGVGLPPRT